MSRNSFKLVIVVVGVEFVILLCVVAPFIDDVAWDKITKIGTLIIAVAALFTAVFSAYIQRQHNYRISKPLLHFSYVSDERKRFMAIYLHNDGLGPAIIKAFCMRSACNGEVFSRNREYHQFIKATFGQDGQNIVPGARFLKEFAVVKSGDMISLASIDFSSTANVTLQNVKDVMLDLQIQIKYTDLYQTKYKTLNILEARSES
jgi:hypothetical protein